MSLRIATAVSAIAAITLVSAASATPFADRSTRSAALYIDVNHTIKPKTAKTDRKGRNARQAGKTKTREAQFRRMVAKHARANGVPTKLAQAIVTIESRYNPKARGKAGEVGLMQIKPATARGIGYKGTTRALYDPETNLRWGMKYLGKAHQLGGGTVCGTVLKYNAGHYAKRMNKTSAKYCSKVKRLLAGS